MPGGTLVFQTFQIRLYFGIVEPWRAQHLKEIATPEVVAFQRSQLSPEEWRQLQSLRSQAEAQTMPIRAGQERQALGASISHLFERSSVLREHEILAEALNQSLGSLDLGQLKQAATNGEGGPGCVHEFLIMIKAATK